MVSAQTIALEDVVRPEFVTYKQAAIMIGVKHDTVRVYQTRSRKLEAEGNKSGLPLFPTPMRIDGMRASAVFRRADIEAYIAAQENRAEGIPGRPPRNADAWLDHEASQAVSAQLETLLPSRDLSKASIARALGIGAGPLRARMTGQGRWRKDEIAPLEELLGVKLLEKKSHGKARAR